MQSVGPNKGRRPVRKSNDALLARGIAVPARRFAGLKLPGFGGAKRPGGAALDRGSGAWRVVVVLLLAGAAGYGFWISGEDGLYGQTKRGAEALTIAAGFGVKRITVEGQQHITDAELTRALGAGPGSFMLAFDTDAAKQRLEQVPWVKHAQVMRLLPSTLQVVIEERVPFAVWQSRGQTYVVDVAGAVIAPAVREAYASLPLVVGEGAGKNAADLFETLKPFDSVTKQMVAALRVGRPALDAEALLRRRRHASRRRRRRRPEDLDRSRSRAEPAPAGDRRRRSSPRRPGERAHSRQGRAGDAPERQRRSRRSDVKH